MHFLADAFIGSRPHPLVLSPSRKTCPMSKTLVIAEKPSVAADLTRALGGKPGRTEFFEVDDYIIT